MLSSYKYLSCGPRIYYYDSYLFERFLSRIRCPDCTRARFRNAFRGLAPRVQNTRHRGYCIVYDAGASAISGLGSGFLKRIPMAKQISFRVSPIHREPPGGEPWGGTELEYRIAERVRAAIGHDEFCEYFCRRLWLLSQDERANGLDRFCSVLSISRLEHPHLLHQRNLQLVPKGRRQRYPAARDDRREHRSQGSVGSCLPSK